MSIERDLADEDLGVAVGEMFDAALRLEENLIFRRQGEINGKRFTIAIAIGTGADHLNSIIDKNRYPDPRSSDFPG